MIAEIDYRAVIRLALLPSFKLNFHAEALGARHDGKTKVSPLVGRQFSERLVQRAKRKHLAHPHRKTESYKRARLGTLRREMVIGCLISARRKKFFSQLFKRSNLTHETVSPLC